MALLIEESLQNSGIQLEFNRVAGLIRGHLSEQTMLFPNYGQTESRLKERGPNNLFPLYPVK